MAKILLTIEDKDDGTPEGTMEVKFTSNRALPTDFSEWTTAEIFVAKLHDTIDFILKDE